MSFINNLTKSIGKIISLCSPQNISGTSRQNSVATFSSTFEVDWDLKSGSIRLVHCTRAHALTPERVRANALSLAAAVKTEKGVNNVFLIHLGSWGLLCSCLISACSVYVLKQIPVYLSCLGEGCNAANLCREEEERNILWTTKTFPSFPLAWRWVDNEGMFLFGWTFSLKGEFSCTVSDKTITAEEEKKQSSFS